MNPPDIGVVDTSVLAGLESRRPLDVSKLPLGMVTTVVTFAELEAGVLAARDVDTTARRLATFDKLRQMDVLSVTADAAHQWARLRVHLRDAGRRMGVNDLWIAAIAVANGLPVVTRDVGFDALDGVHGVSVIRV